MNHQAAAIAHIGQVAEDLEGFNKFFALFTVALEVKTEHGAGAARQQPLCQGVAGVRCQQRVAHARDKAVCRQKLNYFLGIFHVLRHAQRQGFDALQDEPGAVWAHAGPKIAQALAPRPQQEGANGAFFGKNHVVKAFIRHGQLGKFAGLGMCSGPVKTAGIDHHAANHRAVAAQKLGG